MLTSLLGYVLLGLVLFVPLRRLLRWLAARTGLFGHAWHYLQPYTPADLPTVQPAVSPPQPSTAE